MTYLKRTIDRDLEAWQQDPSRKPLLLRGARQVGKSTVVRELAKKFDHFLEINFEIQKEVHHIFSSDLEPRRLCENLAILYDTPIIPGKTLLFFDEIQACLPAISSMRFFYEKMPELHLIAAGSLLEFALGELPSFGVGRIRSLFVYPFSFNEFLDAVGESRLLKAKSNATHEKPLIGPIHAKLIQYLKKFLILGGMPEVVAAYVAGKDLLSARQVLDDLIISLRSDFVKYRRRVSAIRVAEVFESVVRQTGGKYMYSKAGQDLTNRQVKEALELLIMAGLVIPVTHTAANGLPLGATIDPKKRKMILLDTGIFLRLLGLDLSEMLTREDFNAINKGAVAEMHAGLELMKYSSPFRPVDLYYWQREQKNSQAEVDYIIQKQLEILPIEVKSGEKGTMQSLFLFLTEKNIRSGIRLSLENYAVYDRVSVFPLYAVAEIYREEPTIEEHHSSSSGLMI